MSDKRESHLESLLHRMDISQEQVKKELARKFAAYFLCHGLAEKESLVVKPFPLTGGTSISRMSALLQDRLFCRVAYGLLNEFAANANYEHTLEIAKEGRGRAFVVLQAHYQQSPYTNNSGGRTHDQQDYFGE